jgi:hypothetical protein
MKSVADVCFANAPTGYVARDDDGAKARGDSSLEQVARERAILVDINLEPKGSRGSRGDVFKPARRETAEDHQGLCRADAARGREFAIGMRKPMKGRRRCENGHCQTRAKNFASRRAMAHIAQHAIVDS